MRALLPLILAGCAAQAGSLSVAPPAPSSSASLLWSGRLASGSPTTRDLFDDGATTGWTEWDVPTRLTVAETADGPGMTLTYSAASGVAGVYQAAIAGDATYTVHLTMSEIYDVSCWADFGIADDLAGAPATANMYELRLDGATDDVFVIDFADYTTGGVSDDTETDGGFPSVENGGLWMQLCVDDQVSIQGCTSTSGKGWGCSAAITWATTQLSGAHDYVYIGSSGSGACVLTVDYFRADAGAATCPLTVGAFDD